MQNEPLPTPFRGMTLVELLVVVTILGILLAVSVPLLRPMLESRKTSNAAQVLAGAFQQVRMKSIQEGKVYGLRLVPFNDAQTVSVQLRQQQNTPDLMNFPDTRVVVRDGLLELRQFNADPGIWEWQPKQDAELMRKHFQSDYKIEFNRIGRSFIIGEDYKLKPPYDTLNLPEDRTSNDALEYRVPNMPISSWLPQTVMPRGTVVDLVFSGGEILGFDNMEKTEAALSQDDISPDFSIGMVPPCFSAKDEIVITFSPAGHVDTVFINYVPKKVNEMLYFCVGEWDRQVDANGDSMAEDGKSNLESPVTYWVTLHPKTGEVRITENAPIQKNSSTKEEKLNDARKFAKEYFYNIGGF